ncbi:Crp/Fnr family transcriptional regulator [Shimazuella kribbensis]|uniref:Crp/Fnr family transcriptional regulator n=1 Tax=Shimazuella kribbensis TaxID=139808 RepID=UPI00068867C5|nr:Crp/Fnr family transcriptional regulator [Shimazuella kribbensis]
MKKNKKTSMWIENLQFDWSSFSEEATRWTMYKNQVLFDQEETMNQIYVVREGRIRLSITNKLGEEKAIMIVGANGIVGDLGLYASQTYLTSAIAASSCHIYSFPSAVFRQLIEKHPELLRFYLFNLDKKFQLLTTQIVELSYRSARSRVIQLLIQLAETYGVEENDRIRITIRFTQQEMANVAGTSRVTVAQIFQLLRLEKVLTKENGYITLASVAALERLREGVK